MCALKPTVFEGKDRVNKSRCYIECDVERNFRSRIVAPNLHEMLQKKKRCLARKKMCATSVFLTNI